MTIQAPKTISDNPPMLAFLDPLTSYFERLLPIQTVEALYADWQPDGMDVWLVVNQATEEDRNQIFTQELSVLQAFPGLGLDTRMVDRAQVDVNEAIDLLSMDMFLRFPRLLHA